MKTIGLLLEPLDTLFFRGGRPFGAGLPGESSLPSPQSLAGVLRTFLLDCENADFAAMRGKPSLSDSFAAAGSAWLGGACFRGPWLAELGGAAPRPLVAAPADLRFVDGEVVRLQPTARRIPGWQPPLAGMCPLWKRGKKPSKERPQLLSFEGLAAYLNNGPLKPNDVCSHDEFYLLEDRTGVAIDPDTYASKEGEIYMTRNLRLKPGLGFYAEADLPDEKTGHFDAPNTVGWGGERHHVVMRKVPPVTWPEAVGNEYTSLLLLSPAFFTRGWQPDVIPDGQLRAAAVEGPYAVSGWDLVRGGPKPARFGIDAGSVYFIDGRAPVIQSLNENREDTASGYGFFLKGSWHYASE
jgi:CRISPR-associated protein Cmr3